MKYRFDPSHDMILVDPIGAVPFLKGSKLIMPKDMSQPLPMRGRVISQGPGEIDGMGKYVPMPCKPGDVVLYHENLAIIIDRDNNVLVASRGILGVLPDGIEEETWDGDVEEEASAAETEPKSSLILPS